jgi:hypothetical protein
MSRTRRLVLDVLKPHHPNALDFSTTLADLDEDHWVKLTVVEVDKMTETVILVIEGPDIQYDAIIEAIKEMGATVHSIDEVEVEGTNPTV